MWLDVALYFRKKIFQFFDGWVMLEYLLLSLCSRVSLNGSVMCICYDLVVIRLYTLAFHVQRGGRMGDLLWYPAFLKLTTFCVCLDWVIEVCIQFYGYFCGCTFGTFTNHPVYACQWAFTHWSSLASLFVHVWYGLQWLLRLFPFKHEVFQFLSWIHLRFGVPLCSLFGCLMLWNLTSQSLPVYL